jgi:PAS domain S-box-containing protein
VTRLSSNVPALARAVLCTSSDAIIAADGTGTISFWNPGAERIFGYSSTEAIGKSLDIIIPERLRERHWNGYHRVMRGGQSLYEKGALLAVPAVKRDGTRISVEFTLTPLANSAGDLVGLVAILRDVTARFEEMQSLKRKVAATSASS